MPRSVWKGPFVDYKLFKKVQKATNLGLKTPIKTWSRASMILDTFVGHIISVHNGRGHVPLYISDEMVGYRLGEFVLTRLFKGHSGDKAVKGKKGGKK